MSRPVTYSAVVFRVLSAGFCNIIHADCNHGIVASQDGCAYLTPELARTYLAGSRKKNPVLITH